MIEVKIDDTQVRRALQDLQRAVGDLSPAFKEIGEVLVESTKQRFADGKRPDGKDLAKNSPVTIDRKGRNKPLIDEGTLMESIHYALIGNDTLEIGTAMQYAAMQQFGGTQAEFPQLWGDIPARPFLGVSRDDEDAILRILREHLEDAIR